MMESTKQATQRKFTQLRDWLHGNDIALRNMIEQIQNSYPEKDQTWCIDRLWSEESAWRF
jgi:hypothetical protein